MTFVNGTALTAAQLNTHLRDNLLATMPAFAQGSFLYGTQAFGVAGDNRLASYGIGSVEATGTVQIRSSNYPEAAGPSMVIPTGKSALVMFAAKLTSTVNNAGAYASVAVRGNTEIEADDSWSIQLDGNTATNPIRWGTMHFFDNELNPGLNTFEMQYRNNGSDGSAANRELIVWGM